MAKFKPIASPNLRVHPCGGLETARECNRNDDRIGGLETGVASLGLRTNKRGCSEATDPSSLLHPLDDERPTELQSASRSARLKSPPPPPKLDGLDSSVENISDDDDDQDCPPPAPKTLVEREAISRQRDQQVRFYAFLFVCTRLFYYVRSAAKMSIRLLTTDKSIQVARARGGQGMASVATSFPHHGYPQTSAGTTANCQIRRHMIGGEWACIRGLF
jgi:hypothetical protein